MDSQPDARPFAAMLKARREALGKTRDELASALNCSRRCIAAWETGQNQIPLADFWAVARVLGMGDVEIAEAVRLAAAKAA